MNIIDISGCDIEYLSGYLKGLGVFRLISEQLDPDLEAGWNNDILQIRTKFSKDEIIDFFCDTYNPTGLIAPWSINKYYSTKKHGNELPYIDRFSKIREVFKICDDVIESVIDPIDRNEKRRLENILKIECCDVNTEHKIDAIDKKIKETLSDKNKIRLLQQRLRNHLPDHALQWLDSVYILNGEYITKNHICGTGGNDGNGNFSENFIKNLCKIFTSCDRDQCRKLLLNSLFGEKVELLSDCYMSGHFPQFSSNKNSDDGDNKKRLGNPWDYILNMEGGLVYEGTSTRKLSFGAIKKASFPYVTSNDPSGTHDAVMSDRDNQNWSGEIWSPIWNNHILYSELRGLFATARIQVSGRKDDTAVSFAIGAMSASNMLDVSSFKRYVITKRNGKNHLIVPSGTIKSNNSESIVKLLTEIHEWRYRIYKLINKLGNRAPMTMKKKLKLLDDAIFACCDKPGKHNMCKLLRVAGIFNIYLSKHYNEMDNNKQHSSMRLNLSKEWLNVCNDSTIEYRIALSLAGIGRYDNHISSNIFPIKNAIKHVVWDTKRSLISNMEKVVNRRILDISESNNIRMIFDSLVPASLEDVHLFIQGLVNDDIIAEIFVGLVCVDYDNTNFDFNNTNKHYNYLYSLLPDAYCIMKPLFPLKDKNNKYTVYNNICALLSAKRTTEAYMLSSRILKTNKIISNSIPDTCFQQDIYKLRLLASMLIPIKNNDVNLIISRFIRNT